MSIRNPKYLRHLVQTRLGDLREVAITIENVKHPRTFSQNNLYWMWLGEIAEHTGHTAEELHEYYKQTYGSKKVVRGVETPKSTTEYSVGEFTEYLMCVESDAKSMDIVLPDPKDFWRNFIKLG